MKLKIIIAGVAVLVVLGVAAFVMSGDGISASQEQMEKMRGTELYYAHSKTEVIPDPYGEEVLMTNLTDSKVLRMKFDVQYQIGQEWGDDFSMAQAAFTEKMTAIRSSLIMHMRAKKSEDLVGAGMMIFKQEIIDSLNDVVFPKMMGRVTDILVKDFIIQG